MHIYLDESGDLGWSLSLPYQKGGSSRYLVIAALIVPETHIKHVERLIRQLYNTFGWPAGKEKKWVDMTAKARQTFAEATANMLRKHSPHIRCMAIVARKEGVIERRREDSNLLYNFMTKKLLLDEMSHHRIVYLAPDVRSIKVESGNTFKDYLQTELLYTANADTTLHCRHTNSASCKEIQFADMLAGAIGSFHEWGQVDPYNKLKDIVPIQKLFF
ncbi:MAG: DUF3800 domain-containing protein [Pseudomonadota bacterium]